MAGLAFLVLLLVVVVYFNRHLLGFQKGCSWSGSDEVEPGQPRKWLCMTHGKIVVTEDGTVPQTTCDQLS